VDEGRRRWLHQHSTELERRAASFTPTEYRVGRTILIADPGWLPDVPRDLDALRLVLTEQP